MPARSVSQGAPRGRPPCRLHFLLAREASTGVLFRRGPSRWVRLIKWNVADDTFEMGQWFKGRIYEKRGAPWELVREAAALHQRLNLSNNEPLCATPERPHRSVIPPV